MSGEARRPSGRFFRWFERTVLGAGMTVVAWIIERRLLKALKKGSVDAAPRTAAAESQEVPSVRLASTPEQVHDQS